jgi:adenine-specific DNA glycosylase
VASRLGVVNPLFDYYQGKNSMGDLRIQSFARTAFPDDPGKIEGPMSRLGAKDEGGHCWPTEPRCQDCPFEGFCQKLFLDFNPAEKGMILL